MKEKLHYISNNIRSYRVRAGMTQEDVAKTLNISRMSYVRYENNPQKLKMETLQQIANIFHCNVVDFFVQSNVTDSNI